MLHVLTTNTQVLTIRNERRDALEIQSLRLSIEIITCPALTASMTNSIRISRALPTSATDYTLQYIVPHTSSIDHRHSSEDDIQDLDATLLVLRPPAVHF